MNRASETKVYILGAGCSADWGYLLGAGLLTELQEFIQRASDDYPKIKNSVKETVKLLASIPDVKTLDELVQRIELNWQNRTVSQRCRNDKDL